MHFKEFFYMNKSDRSVLLVLLTVGLVVMALIYGLGSGRESTDNAQEQMAEDNLSAAEIPYGSRGKTFGRSDKDRHEYVGYVGTEGHPAERFPFDPNTADSTQLLRLGLRPWQVRNIYKYRANGGNYRKPSDFARLYGLTRQQYRSLEPYIRISDDFLPAASQNARKEPSTRDTLLPPLKMKEGECIALNGADTTQLKRVPGIGSYYARRIVNYGERLGGYVSTKQLTEIEGFPEKAIGFFTISGEHVRKMNLNKLTLSQLRQHPYINFHQAKAISDYRRMHGPLQSLDDLRLLEAFPPEAIERLKPYVEF